MTKPSSRSDLRAAQVSDGDLQVVLQRSLNDGDRAHSIANIVRRTFDYESTYPLEVVDIRFQDGENLQLLFKNLDLTAVSPGRKGSKPWFLCQPSREIYVYRDILNTASFGTARCYGWSFIPEVDRAWLFLERVQGSELTQIGEWETWRDAARWLATFHAHFESPERIDWLAQKDWLLQRDAAYYRQWIERSITQSTQRERAKFLQRLSARYDTVVDHIMELPVTFIHGEFYPSNILVRRKEQGQTICPVDWEMAGVAPAALDLAALIVGKWTDAQQQALVRSYYGATSQASLEEDWDSIRLSLRFCMLHLAVQWLGWSPDWSPPKSQAFDWYGEAIRLAEDLQLV